MGVPGLFSHLRRYNRRNNPTSTIKSILPRVGKEPVHLYLDFNGAIYQVIRPEIQTNEALIIHVLSYLDSLVEIFKYKQPITQFILNEFSGIEEEVIITDDDGNIIYEDGPGIQMIERLYIAIDGTPPRAKMEQQRCRRFHSICHNYRMDTINKEYGDALDTNTTTTNTNTNTNPTNKIDKNMITPGTVFMQELRTAMANHLNTSPNMQEIHEIIFSDWSNPGEGEHKIMDYIRENPPHEPIMNDDGDLLMPKTVIYGLDGDLIMLAMSSQIRNVYLVREAYEYKQYSFEHRGYPYLFMDVDCLKSALLAESVDKISTALVNDDDKSRFIDDYILTSMLLGNDFMPKIPWLNLRNNGPQIIHNAYLEVFNSQIYGDYRFLYNRDTGQINMEMFASIMAILMRRENNLAIKCMDTRLAWKPRISPEMTEHERQVYMMEHLPMQHLDIEAPINPRQPKWRNRFYNICHGFNSNPSNINAVCDAYLKTLIWNMHYYTLDGCPSWSWYYPYDYCPTIADFYYHIQNMTNGHKHIKFDAGQPISPQVLLLMVLPEQSSGLMADSVQKLILNSTGLARLYFPRKYALNMALHTKYYECTPKGVGKIDMDRTTSLVKKCKLTSTELERNTINGEIHIFNNINTTPT